MFGLEFFILAGIRNEFLKGRGGKLSFINLNKCPIINRPFPTKG